MSDILKLDLYKLLSVSDDSTEQEIKSSYRRLALGCHPDKHPDNPQALQLFHQLSKALEILTDSSAKASYDRLLKARKTSALRHKSLDKKRQKLRDELEAREKAAKEDVMSEAEATDRLNREIERLRKEGSKQLETENEFLRQTIQEEIKRMAETNLNKTQTLPKIKIIKKSKDFRFDSENLNQFFSRFGEINALVLTKNNKKALIEFKEYKQSLNVYESRQEFEHLFAIEWIGEKPYESGIDFSQNISTNQSNDINIEQNESFSTDYESLVLTNLRRAEERKQLIKQMERQSTDD